MYSSTILKKKDYLNPSLKAHVNKKHKFIFVPCDEVEINASDLQWSGGTRYQYHMIEIESGRNVSINLFGLASFHFPSGKLSADIEIPAGHALIKSGTFCGKNSAETIFGRANEILIKPVDQKDTE